MLGVSSIITRTAALFSMSLCSCVETLRQRGEQHERHEVGTVWN